MQQAESTMEKTHPACPRRLVVIGAMFIMAGALWLLLMMPAMFAIGTSVILELRAATLEWIGFTIFMGLFAMVMPISWINVGYKVGRGRKNGQRWAVVWLGVLHVLFMTSALSNWLVWDSLREQETSGFFSWGIWKLEYPILILLVVMLVLLISPKANAYFKACEQRRALQTP